MHELLGQLRGGAGHALSDVFLELSDALGPGTLHLEVVRLEEAHDVVLVVLNPCKDLGADFGSRALEVLADRGSDELRDLHAHCLDCDHRGFKTSVEGRELSFQLGLDALRVALSSIALALQLQHGVRDVREHVMDALHGELLLRGRVARVVDGLSVVDEHVVHVEHGPLVVRLEELKAPDQLEVVQEHVVGSSCPLMPCVETFGAGLIRSSRMRTAISDVVRNGLRGGRRNIARGRGRHVGSADLSGRVYRSTGA